MLALNHTSNGLIPADSRDERKREYTAGKQASQSTDIPLRMRPNRVAQISNNYIHYTIKHYNTIATYSLCLLGCNEFFWHKKILETMWSHYLEL